MQKTSNMDIGSKIKRISCGTDTFEVVDFVPGGYQIWNIGKHMIDGYLPLCQLKGSQPFPGAMEIETETLKAIKTEGAQKILAAIGGGQNTVEKMEKYIQRYRNAKLGTWTYNQVQRIKEALPYIKQLKWH